MHANGDLCRPVQRNVTSEDEKVDSPSADNARHNIAASAGGLFHFIRRALMPRSLLKGTAAAVALGVVAALLITAVRSFG